MSDPLTTALTGALIKELASLAAKGAVKIVSSSGRVLGTYFISLSSAKVEADEEDHKNLYPPMIVVGLGRCGSFVTGQLLSMLSQAASSNADKSSNQNQQETNSRASNEDSYNRFRTIFSGFVTKKSDDPGSIITVEPKMFMGDIDETVFGDVVRIVNKSDDRLSRKILQISYEPLAYGGVGNTPIFSEFLTRGLLLLPPVKNDLKDNQWQNARNLLLDGYSVHGQKLRLAFYIFSASGGTGSGSANEFLRAQRFSLAVSSVPHQVFFCGITVLPRRELLEGNQTHQRNAGRLLTQYLSELNIYLPNTAAFETAPVFKFDAHLRVDRSAEMHSLVKQKDTKAVGSKGDEPIHSGIPLPSWDALLFISNDVMPVDSSGDSTYFEIADREANMYIAQCMFNISSAQLPIAQFNNEIVLEERNFQSRRLDPNDLRTGLNGPACVGFSAITLQDARQDDRWIERLFVSSISVPSRKVVDGASHSGAAFIQGLSVGAEQNRAAYIEKISRLANALDAKDIKEFDAALAQLAAVRLFKTCPRAIFIFTSPQTGEIPANIETKIDELMKKLCPNIVQLRTAFIRGTTTTYTATILFETSVVNCSDMLYAFSNYLRLSFSKPGISTSDFQQRIIDLINNEDKIAIDEKEVEDLLEESEIWSRTVTNYQNQADGWERNWNLFKERQRSIKNELVSRESDELSMDHLSVTRRQVVNALNYIKYARHFAKGGSIVIPD